MLLLNKTSEAEKLLSIHPGLRWILAAIFLAAILATCLLPRDNWPVLLMPYAIAFVVYMIVLRHNPVHGIRYWLGIAILARIALVFTFPNLSDDIYRFIWDGQLSISGINPYEYTPSEFTEPERIPGGQELLARMNSPNYHTVYPPVLQVFFALAAWAGGSSWFVSSIVLKSILLLSELATLLLLAQYFRRMERDESILLYALNPLVIIELVGNIHFEAIMILGLAVLIISVANSGSGQAWFKRIASMVGGLLLAIGSKLLPVITVPFLLRRLKFRAFLTVCSIAVILLAISFLPVIRSQSGNGMLASINLYFQTFEFNASIYYILRWFGYLWKGYNMINLIGLITAGITIMILLSLFLFERRPSAKNLPVILLFAFTTYFLLANVVHPWYISTLVMLSAFTRFYFAIVWSGLVFLSYATYRTEAYAENYWLVGIEYTIVIGIMVYELLGGRSRNVISRRFR